VGSNDRIHLRHMLVPSRLRTQADAYAMGYVHGLVRSEGELQRWKSDLEMNFPLPSRALNRFGAEMGRETF
jgi:hypothetical protein